MFRLGVPELLIIGVIVLFLFGGKRLPEMGKGIAIFGTTPGPTEMIFPQASPGLLLYFPRRSCQFRRL